MSENLLRVLFHAPTAAALARARNNATNLKRASPNAEVRIIANAQAVAPALDTVHELQDPVTWLCPISLAGAKRATREPLQVLPGPAVLEIAQLQQAGWAYIRA